MSNKYIIAHDMGTSADKAIIISVKGEIIDIAKKQYPLHNLKPGYAEQDPNEWWEAVCETTRSVIKKTAINPKDIVGMTFSTQTQCLVPVDKNGNPLRNAFSWLDGRSAEIVRQKLWTVPRIKGYNVFRLLKFLIKTGGAPGHTGKEQIGKILWMQKYEPHLFKNTYKFLDAKDFLIYKLTGNFVTSVDLAVIWWLLNTRKNKNKWDDSLCKYANITQNQLCEVKPSASIAGYLTEEASRATGLLSGTPIINGAGDLASAALGSGAIDEGELHISLGTSGWVAGHFSKRKIDLNHYTGCIGSTYPEKYFLAMAHQETAGICLEWLKNKILYHEQQLMEEWQRENIYEILDELAVKAGPGAHGLIFTPWMFGERSPLDDDFVRAGLYNVSLDHSREHIVRAVFEGIAFNTRWAMEIIENLYSEVDHLNIIGGGAKSDIWCQIFADVLNKKINRVAEPQQAAARGIALLASMTLGYIESFYDIKKYIKIDRTFYPNNENRKLYDYMFKEFKNLYKQNKSWFKRMNKERMRS
ncbi:FGGY-family carbohydrate kinase [Melioribacteraceae bacterium 4301-Me]|uniref:xylulokinase n=1 Tax=Pyranulibacter aquaticus TaxID=3163344 RepID=UPI003595103E